MPLDGGGRASLSFSAFRAATFLSCLILAALNARTFFNCRSLGSNMQLRDA